MQDGAYTFVSVFQDSAQDKGKRRKSGLKSIRVGKECWDTGILILLDVHFRFLKKSGGKCKKWELKV